MGKVMTKLTLTNVLDTGKVDEGLLKPEQVRSLVLEALVDTGATSLVIPEDAAVALGLRVLDRRKVKLADGTIRELSVVTDLMIEILGRKMACDAFVTPVGSMALIGQIPLEGLDLVVDPKSREAMPNPASPDGPMLDLLRAS
jgi:clan AA aspartic protease